MAIERGVDEIDISELEIEDNSKEIEISVEDEAFEEIVGPGGDEEGIETLEDGTMLVGMPPPMPVDQGEDFFENIAPKVGVTAEMFRNLSGPEALQLYYNSI